MLAIVLQILLMLLPVIIQIIQKLYPNIATESGTELHLLYMDLVNTQQTIKNYFISQNISYTEEDHMSWIKDIIDKMGEKDAK